MKPLYNYQPYDHPKKGVFEIMTGEYQLPTGWLQKEEVFTIIGESDDTFVYQLKASGHGVWVGNKVIKKKYILPMGIHKSRLVKWISGQLTMFDQDQFIWSNRGVTPTKNICRLY